MDFELWLRSDILDKRKIERILDSQVKHYCGIPIEQWEDWAIKRVPKDEIERMTGLPFNTIVSVYKHEFGGMDAIRIGHIRKRIIKLRREGIRLEDIYKFHIEKGETFYPSNYRRDIRTWFDGMSPDEVESKWGSETKDMESLILESDVGDLNDRDPEDIDWDIEE